MNESELTVVSPVMREILTAMVVAGMALALAAPAAAGGAVWETDRRYYRPGDAGAAETAVAWAHNPQLGTPGDGPYFAWLESGDIVWGELRVLGPPPGPRPSVPAGLGPYPV